MKKSDKVTDLKQLPYNPRSIGEKEMDRLKASIERHTLAVNGSIDGDGLRLVSSITVNKNGNRIVGGNQRFKALAELGQDWVHKDDITMIDVEPDSAQEKEIMISLNRQDSVGSWDDQALQGILAEIANDDSEAFDDLDFGSFSDQFEVLDGLETLSNVTLSGTNDDLDDDPPAPRERTQQEPQDGDTPPITDRYNDSPGSQMMNLQDEEEDEQGPGDNLPTLFPLSYAVTGEQRKMIVDALAKAKKEFSVETSADALAAICGKYLG